MVDAQAHSGQQTVENLSAFVMQQLRAGAEIEFVINQLESKGLGRHTATALVEQVHAQLVTQIPMHEAPDLASILPAVIGGMLAAVIGGLIWAAIAITTGYEIGYVAWGIGGLAGIGVVLFAKGKKGVPVQIVAVLASVLGIVIGKYGAFFHFLKEVVAEEYGPEAVAQMSLLSLGTLEFFFASIGSMLGGFDFLWILLAVSTAWGIPKQMTEGSSATA